MRDAGVLLKYVKYANERVQESASVRAHEIWYLCYEVYECISMCENTSNLVSNTQAISKCLNDGLDKYVQECE